MEEVVNMGEPHSPDWVAVGMRRACEMQENDQKQKLECKVHHLH